MAQRINPIDGFTVERSAIRYLGADLQRPECILAEPDGTLWSADARGGVMRLRHDGSQTFIGQRASDRFGSAAAASAGELESKFTQGTLPNGLAFAANGDILISNFGTVRLEVMTRDGSTRTLIDRIDGAPIGKSIRHGPGFESASDFEAQVIVEAAGRMALDAKTAAFDRRVRRSRFRSAVKCPFPGILIKWHSSFP